MRSVLVKLRDWVRFAHTNWFPTLRGWRVVRAGNAPGSCGSGSRFNGGRLTTAYPFVRAGLITTCCALWGSVKRARLKSTRCALGIMRLRSDSTRTRRWSVRPFSVNYWAMPWPRECAASTRAAGLLAGGTACGRGVDVGRNPSTGVGWPRAPWA